MNNYRRYNSDLYHWGFKKDHKYIAKVKVTPRKWRYFYDKDEYEAYLKGKQKTDALRGNTKNTAEKSVGQTSISKAGKTTTISTVDSVRKESDGSITFNKTTKIYNDVTPEWMNNAVDKIDKAVIDPIVDKGKAFVSKIKDVIPKDSESSSDDSEKTVFDKIVDAGKEFVSKIFPKESEDETKPKYVAKVALPNNTAYYFYDRNEFLNYKKREEYQANEPWFMKGLKKLATPTTAEEDMFAINKLYEQSLANNTSDYTLNCALCSTAYELRRRGYDVDADAFSENGMLRQTIASNLGYLTKDLSNIFKEGLERSFIYKVGAYENAKVVASKPETLIADLTKHPNTRGELAIAWKSGSGHSIVYEVDDLGNVVFRDCQSSTIYVTGGVNAVVDMQIKLHHKSATIEDEMWNDMYQQPNSTNQHVEGIDSIKVDYAEDLLSRMLDVKYIRTDNLELGEEILRYIKRN